MVDFGANLSEMDQRRKSTWQKYLAEEFFIWEKFGWRKDNTREKEHQGRQKTERKVLILGKE